LLSKKIYFKLENHFSRFHFQEAKKNKFWREFLYFSFCFSKFQDFFFRFSVLWSQSWSYLCSLWTSFFGMIKLIQIIKKNILIKFIKETTLIKLLKLIKMIIFQAIPVNSVTRRTLMDHFPQVQKGKLFPII